ncbi:recombinase family protein [Aliiruegeria sabulilitoris]|uniref:recombinase family protein n=1 Tax=Aliiruegeria sabulilitoris TaxID=1510458 RepID=UPI00082AB57B|nr:recombinase family protein [Aliiruegeria sabulilitoris]NDR55684.1 recombinase family protein [Pseudoruegeria sp. M32A2M]
MRAAIYARYSTEMQREASIEDQFRICRRLIEQNGWTTAQTYADAGLSGASHLRPGYQQMLQDARDGRFDVAVAEGLDRISRDQEHIAAFFKQLRFQGISIVTVAEGEISELHIGLKGTMSSLFLKDLALKTHRGLEGRVQNGKSAGGVTYGYDVLRSIGSDGNVSTGDRTINEEQADIVRRIFQEYVDGHSPRAIAGRLNDEGIDGPRGRGWGMSTIYGNWRRGTGILNNELYVGRLVWNRQRFLKDPATGRRQARMNTPEQWVKKDVPELRIVPNELWEKVKARQKATRSTVISEGVVRSERAKRPAYLFSGLVKCGCCGGGFTLVGKTYYGCANARNKGTCDNKMTVRRDRLEDTVLGGLKDQLLHPDLIAAFVTEYQAEYNRLAGEITKDKSKAERKLAGVKRRIDQLVDRICDGMFHESMKDKLTALEQEKAALETELATFDADVPVRLHPGLSDVYRAKVAKLTESLNNPDLRTAASEHIRSLISEIRMVPEGDSLQIELVGELAGLMALSQKSKARGDATGCSITMVAGVGFEPTTFRL